MCGCPVGDTYSHHSLQSRLHLAHVGQRFYGGGETWLSFPFDLAFGRERDEPLGQWV